MKYVLYLLLSAAMIPALAKERDRCPFETPQQIAALQAIDQKIGGHVEARNVAVGRMTCDGKPCGTPVAQSDIDAKRAALANAEIWTMSLTDQQLKTDYLCAIMSHRRALDEADLEMVDHHLQKEMDAKSAPIPTPK